MRRSSNILYEKLETFIKKYYKNQLFKGVILTVSISIIAFFVMSFMEYLGRFNSGLRLALFTIYLLGTLAIVVWYIVRPILGLINIARKLNYEQASTIIGGHFPEVKDKLLNTLQLNHEAESTSNNALLLASIEQKTAELKPIPFSNAIQFKKNLRYVKMALVPAVALLIILIIAPGFKSSSERLVKFNQEFEIEAPFKFVVDQSVFNTIQNQDISIPVQLKGDQIPKDAYIHIDNVRYKMKSTATGKFIYNIRNIQQESQVWFEAAGFNSKRYNLDVALKPGFLAYNASLIFPKYLGRENQSVSNIGEITIPEGTTIQWNFDIKNVDEITVLPDAEKLKSSNNKASYSRRFLSSTLLKVKTSNEEVRNGDSLFYQINVIPDEFPQISAEQQADSMSSKIIYFLGDIEDDHGFSKLSFHYSFKNQKIEREKNGGQTSIALDPKIAKQSFYHYWNLNELELQPEEEIEYYFTVWDNDGVNGAKATKTQKLIYKAPSLKEIKEQTEKSSAEIKNSLSDAQTDAEQLKKEIQSSEKMLTEKKNLDWNDKKKIEDLLKKQEELEKKIKESIDKNLEKNFKEEEFKKVDPEIQEKQKKLEELFDEVMDDEMKELMEKIRKLMEENKMDQLQEQMNKFEFSQKEMSKELDRMLELYKELELEKKLKETIQELNELAEEQKDLADKSAKESDKNELLEKRQKELNEKFDDLKKDLEDINNKNEELETPKNIEAPEDKAEDIQKDMKESSDELNKGKNAKASEKQKEASEEMKEMAEDLKAQMDAAYAEQQEEDYHSLRQILENLIQLSFDQEHLIDEFKENRNYSPKYIALRQEQRKIIDESKLVEDSLLALSKRVIQIQHFINEEIARVNDNLDKTLAHLGERETNDALVNQQYVMTGYNNLALMLSESLKQMQEKMKSQKESDGQPNPNCKNPSSGKNGKKKKPNMNAVKKMQQELAKQLEDMQNGKQKGKKPGSKEFAEAAAMQAAIREQLREIERQLQKEGKGGSLGNLKQTQDMMDDLEKDLYYKKLNSETIDRMRQIEIKLSEHEKAEQKQEQDDKRAANEGEDVKRELPPSIKKYLEEKAKEKEQLKSVSPELQPYYKKKVEEYFCD